MSRFDSGNLLAMRASILERNDALQRAVRAGATATATGGVDGGKPAATNFAEVMKGAVSQANELQAQSAAMTEAYEKGEITDIAAVMLSRQTAAVSFETTLLVRNKLLSDFKEIMSMPG